LVGGQVGVGGYFNGGTSGLPVGLHYKMEKGGERFMVRRQDFLISPKEKLIEAIKSGKTEEALRFVNDLHEMFVACMMVSLML
jgi:hypothetical protein